MVIQNMNETESSSVLGGTKLIFAKVLLFQSVATHRMMPNTIFTPDFRSSISEHSYEVSFVSVICFEGGWMNQNGLFIQIGASLK